MYLYSEKYELSGIMTILKEDLTFLKGKLYSEGLVPVYRASSGGSETSKWKKVDENTLDIVRYFVLKIG